MNAIKQMKKIMLLIVFTLGLGLFLSSAKSIKAADCNPAPSNRLCPGQTACDIGTNRFCCTSSASCNKLQQQNGSCSPAPANKLCPGQTACDIGLTRYCCNSSGACTQFKSTNQAPAADVHGGCGENGISTAIGCIGVLEGQTQFLGDILRWAVGIGGGIAFLLIVYAGFMIMTAAGNPERLKAGQELLTSAISGLILLILSVFVLRFIGIDILGLNQFGFGSQQ